MQKENIFVVVALCMQTEVSVQRLGYKTESIRYPFYPIKIGTLILKMVKHVCNVNALACMLCKQIVFNRPCCYYVGFI